MISALLGDWSGFDLDAATRYIVESQSYDGAFGMGPGLEGHGTYTCTPAISALSVNGARRLYLLRSGFSGAHGQT